MRSMVLAWVAVTACGLSSPMRDGGAGGEGGSAAGGGSAGGTAGGAGAAAGAGGVDGGTRPFSWGMMAVPPANAYRGIGGTGSGSSVVLYVGQQSARIARYANSTWTTVYQDPRNANITALWVSPNEEVFAVGAHSADSCLSNCSQQSSWSNKVLNGVDALTGVCGVDLQHVYAVGNDFQSVGLLLKYNPATTQWDSIANNTGSTSNAACWVAPNHDVYIAAQSKIVRYDGSTLTSETIAFPTGWTTNDIALQLFFAVSGNATNVYATGTGKRVIWRDAPGHWVFALDPDAESDFNALAVDASGALAAGSSWRLESIAATGASGAWELDPNAPNSFSALSAWAAGPDEYYVAGNVANSLSGVIYRLSR